MLFSIGVFLAAVASAWACSCSFVDRRTSMCKARYVVTGKVQSKECDDEGGAGNNGRCTINRYTISGAVAYRRDGARLTKIDNLCEIEVITGASGSMCGVNLPVGEDVVFATAASSITPTVRIGLCDTVSKYRPSKDEVQKFIGEANNACATEANSC